MYLSKKGVIVTNPTDIYVSYVSGSTIVYENGIFEIFTFYWNLPRNNKTFMVYLERSDNLPDVYNANFNNLGVSLIIIEMRFNGKDTSHSYNDPIDKKRSPKDFLKR